MTNKQAKMFSRPKLYRRISLKNLQQLFLTAIILWIMLIIMVIHIILTKDFAQQNADKSIDNESVIYEYMNMGSRSIINNKNISLELEGKKKDSFRVEEKRTPRRDQAGKTIAAQNNQRKVTPFLKIQHRKEEKRKTSKSNVEKRTVAPNMQRKTTIFVKIKETKATPSKKAVKTSAFVKTQRKPTTHLKIQNKNTASKLKEGRVNVDIWENTCSVNFNSLRQLPIFPRFPTQKAFIKVTDSISYEIKDKFTAIRIMGFLHPPKTGGYSFHLKTPGIAQLWFGIGWPWISRATEIAHISQNKVRTEILHIRNTKAVSEMVHLRRGKKYYFEILQAINDPLPKPEKLSLYWMLPGSNNFTAITGNQVSEYDKTSSSYQTPNRQDSDNTPPSLMFSDIEDESVSKYYQLDKRRSELIRKPVFTLKPYVSLGIYLDANNQEFNRDTASTVSYIDSYSSEILSRFLNCTIYNSNAKRTKRIVKRNEGVYFSRDIHVFPPDESDLLRGGSGNPVLALKEIIQVLLNFMKQINANSTSKYKLHSVINMERLSPKSFQYKKYFLELVLRRDDTKRLFRFSEYLLTEKTTTTLCFPGIKWNPKVWINVILNVRNQPGWVVDFVKQMANIIKTTRDQYVNIIVADYGNEGVNVIKEILRNGLKSYIVFKVSGKFHKTYSINKAVSQIKNPNSIVFLMDLHLKIPLNIFDVVRKHTIQGRTGFSPQVVRLTPCGRPKTKHIYPEGSYETTGLGIFSIYKSDWDIFGGMNEAEFKNRWGGEDWEMADRVIMSGYEIEKLKLPGFLHFFHDKKGMWDI